MSLSPIVAGGIKQLGCPMYVCDWVCSESVFWPLYSSLFHQRRQQTQERL